MDLILVMVVAPKVLAVAEEEFCLAQEVKVAFLVPVLTKDMVEVVVLAVVAVVDLGMVKAAHHLTV
jgi:hypothetical protein